MKRWGTALLVAVLSSVWAGSATAQETANQAPQATGDAYVIDVDQTLNVATPGILDNDSDPESTTLTAILEAGPANGTLTLNADGSFSYTPNAGFTGDDSFTYAANDGELSSDPATVAISVQQPSSDDGTEEDDNTDKEDATPAMGDRRGFVGVVTSYDGATVAITLANGNSVSLAIAEETTIRTPGAPAATDVAGTLAEGAQVVALGEWADEGWRAVQIVVKPIKPAIPPLVGTVTSVEANVVIVTLKNGGAMTIELPEGMTPPAIGEIITVFTSVLTDDDDDGRGEKRGKAKGLVTASEVRERLEKFLLESEQEAASDTESGSDEDETTEKLASRLDKLAEVLEHHVQKQLEILTAVNDDEILPEKAQEHIQKALDKAAELQEEAQEKAEKARRKAEEARRKAEERLQKKAESGDLDEQEIEDINRDLQKELGDVEKDVKEDVEDIQEDIEDELRDAEDDLKDGLDDQEDDPENNKGRGKGRGRGRNDGGDDA